MKIHHVSFKTITSRITTHGLVALVLAFPASSPFAQSICIDTDGDGWGWNGEASCLTTTQDSEYLTTQELMENLPCFDTDGDGWGWNGLASCIVDLVDPDAITILQPIIDTLEPTSDQACIDTDGDGWGWDGEASCLIDEPPLELPPSPTIDTISDSDSETIEPITEVEEIELDEDASATATDLMTGCTVLSDENITGLVTDVVLTAGQSNATGYNTSYEPETYDEDTVSPRLIAWTELNGWQIANPQTQLWDADNYVPNISGSSIAFNHPAFQIGKSILSEDPCRVVALIATAASGRQISHWLNNVNNHFDDINNKVETALLSLPNKSQIDMIWWMQGEADNGLPEDEYTSSLATLIDDFRNLSWFGSDKYFLANETRVSKNTNKSIRALRGNGDWNTDYSAGEDECNLCVLFPHIVYEDDPNDIVHFNAIAFRKIGKEVANKYVFEYVN